MWKQVSGRTPRYFAGSLAVCCLPTFVWSFFPPIDLYPPPASLAPVPVIEQPVPPVPTEPIVAPPVVITPTTPIVTPPIRTVQTPEPATLGLAAIGVGLLALRRRSRP